MSDVDWYRRTTWSDRDQQEFFARLKKSRTLYNKAQYVRIQASYLAGVGTPELIKASMKLLDLFFEKYPERSEIASSYKLQGDNHFALGESEEGLTAWRQAIEAQRRNSGSYTMVHLDYAWYVATSSLHQDYEFALDALEEFADICLFPKDIYQSQGSRALIFMAVGLENEAKSAALLALEAASRDKSGFRHHTDVGLVQSPNKDVHERLIAIAEG